MVFVEIKVKVDLPETFRNEKRVSNPFFEFEIKFSTWSHRKTNFVDNYILIDIYLIEIN